MLTKNRLRFAEQAAGARFEIEKADLTGRLAATECRLEEIRTECDQTRQSNVGLQAELTEEKRLRSGTEALNKRIPELQQEIRECESFA
jgi:hypothetical protein